MKGEGGGGGEPEMFAQGGNSCFPALRWCNSGMKTPVPVLMYLSCPIFFQCIFHSAHMCKYCLKKKGKFNGYCNECWLSGSEKQEEKKKRKCAWILRGAEEGLFRCSGVVGFHEEEWFGGETWLFFPLLLFPRTQGSRLLQEGRALPRHASLEGFLQATSRLFGCHWDCLKRICFCTVLQGAPHQEKSRSPLSTWHCCYAFVNIKAKRLGQCV